MSRCPLYHGDVVQQRVREDIAVSIKQLDAGEGIPLAEVMKGVRSRYAKPIYRENQP